MPQLNDAFKKRIDRWMERHALETRRVMDLIERSPHLELLEKGPSCEYMLVNFACRTLRTVPHQTEPILRENTPVYIVCPPIGLFEFSHLRVATELLPTDERPFSPNIQPTKLALICTGDKWTPATFSLDLLLMTAWDVLRGANVIADFRDTFNPQAIGHYQRLESEGQLPLDPRELI